MSMPGGPSGGRFGTGAEPVAAKLHDARLEAARKTIAALPALQREILDLRVASLAW